MKLSRIAAIVLVLCLLGTCITASAQTRASEVFSQYNISIGADSGNKIEVYVDVFGTQVIDKIGFSKIQILEKQPDDTWAVVKSVPNKYMLNSLAHDYTITYTGVSGRNYKGKATYYGKIGDIVETRKLTSAVVTAHN